MYIPELVYAKYMCFNDIRYYQMIQIFDIYSFEWGGKLLTEGVLRKDKLNISHHFGLVGLKRQHFSDVILENDIFAPSPALTCSCLEFFLSVCGFVF